MKALSLAIVTTLIVTACALDRMTIDVIRGADGHSIVSQFLPATELECASGGTRLDLYVDRDDSLTASDGDSYQGSMIACNGANGLNGENGLPGAQGPQGIPGEFGPPGHDGIAGPPGLNGNPGHDGTPGSNGEPGPRGEPGHGGGITQHNVAICTMLAEGFYLRTGSGNENGSVGIYGDAYCTGHHEQLTDAKSTFWLSETTLAIYVDSQTVRVLTFN